MPRTRLVSFLGRGRFVSATKTFEPYTPTRHRLYNQTFGPTPFICRSLAEYLDADEIDIVATQEAEDDLGQALTQALKEARLSHAPQVSFHRIHIGETETELWQQFDIIKRRLRAPKDTVVAIDMTHGLRAQPFFAAAVIAFVRAVDPAPAPVRVFYGAFDPGGGDVTPVWELTPFIDLLDWAQGLRLFLRTGRSDEVAERTIDFGNELSRRWAATKQGLPPQLKSLGQELHQFGRNIETVRSGALLLDNKPGSAARLKERIAAARGEVAALPPLADILDRLEGEMVSPLLGAEQHLATEAGLRAMAALARLYREMGRFMEAAAIAREGWITIYADAAGALARGIAPDAQQQARKDAEARWREREGDIARTVSNIRNDIEHAAFNPHPIPAQSLCDQIGRLVEDFAAAAAKAVADPIANEPHND